MASKQFIEKVSKIQQGLKAPKGQTNKFGNYKYRSCEDILEAVKPLLGELVLTVNDEMVEVGGRVYVKAITSLTDGTDTITNTAYAREPMEQKGMSESQLTGTASSYARKYALNGLFLIDDTKDADTNEFKGEATATSKIPVTKTVAESAGMASQTAGSGQGSAISAGGASAMATGSNTDKPKFSRKAVTPPSEDLI